MKEHGVMFSRPMVLALLQGRKTQTRRLATSPLRRIQVGDSIWVRETGNWQTGTEVAPQPGRKHRVVWYDADGHPDGLSFFGNKKRPAIHMPRWASRLTLDVTDVRFQRLQDISEDDAMAEGVGRPYLGDGDPPFEEQAVMVSCRTQYRNLWRSLHGFSSWDENPEVVAITFEVRKSND